MEEHHQCKDYSHDFSLLSVCRFQYWKALRKLVAPGGVVVWPLFLDFLEFLILGLHCHRFHSPDLVAMSDGFKE